AACAEGDDAESEDRGPRYEPDEGESHRARVSTPGRIPNSSRRPPRRASALLEHEGGAEAGGQLGGGDLAVVVGVERVEDGVGAAPLVARDEAVAGDVEQLE